MTHRSTFYPHGQVHGDPVTADPHTISYKPASNNANHPFECNHKHRTGISEISFAKLAPFGWYGERERGE